VLGAFEHLQGPTNGDAIRPGQRFEACIPFLHDDPEMLGSICSMTLVLLISALKREVEDGGEVELAFMGPDLSGCPAALGIQRCGGGVPAQPVRKLRCVLVLALQCLATLGFASLNTLAALRLGDGLPVSPSTPPRACRYGSA
jgi:hypothetical protein